jgi:hypothetical protein
MCCIFAKWNYIIHSVYGMGMDIGKASGMVTFTPRAQFGDSCSREVATSGMPLIITQK